MYTIIFEDKTEFHGGEPSNSKWNEIPDKPIAELLYNFSGKKIYLKNYESYNHLTKYAFHVESKQQIIVAVIIMVKELGVVKRITFDLINQQLITDVVPYGNEYNNKPASGWKAGLIGLKQIYKIN